MALGVSRSKILTKKSRSTDWADLRKSPPKADDADLKDAIACVVKNRASYGYRRVWARLKIDGRQIIHKRVYRVMRDEGWLLFRQGQKPLDTRKHEGTVAVKESDTRWCSDELELSCDNGERVRVAFALDYCDKETINWVATTKGIDAGLIGDLMMQAVEKRFGSNDKPSKTIEWLTDNGICYTADETRSFAKELGVKPVTTPVTSPQSNGMAESFVKTLKRDYAKLAYRSDSKTVMVQLKDWIDDYNSYHPHSALGYLPPKLFRVKRSVT
jgi:putative transposase